MGIKSTPDLQRNLRFVHPVTGDETQLEYEDTGNTLADGTKIFRMVVGTSSSVAPPLLDQSSMDLSEFAQTGTWEDEDAAAITSASLSKLFDRDNATFFKTTNGSITLQFEVAERLDLIYLTLKDLTTLTAGDILVKAMQGDGTLVTIIDETLPTGTTDSLYLEGLINSTQPIIYISVEILNLNVGASVNVADLGISTKVEMLVEEIKLVSEPYNATLVGGASAESDEIDLSNVKGLAVQVDATYHASALSGITVDALTKMTSGSTFDTDFYALDLEPSFAAGTTKRVTSLIDTIPKTIKFAVTNVEATESVDVIIRIVRLY